MPYKVCPSCNQTSYSAAERGIWYCPYCGADMTFCNGCSRQVRHEDATSPHESLPNYLRVLQGHNKE